MFSSQTIQREISDNIRNRTFGAAKKLPFKNAKSQEDVPEIVEMFLCTENLLPCFDIDNILHY